MEHQVLSSCAILPASGLSVSVRMDLSDSGDCRGLSSCDSKTTDSPEMDWQGLGLQCLARGQCLQGSPACPLGRWSGLHRAFPTFLASPASLYSCFQAGSMLCAPREQTFCGDQAWACSLGSWGGSFPRLLNGYVFPSNPNHIHSQRESCIDAPEVRLLAKSR